jgi:hypothetical protein
VQNPAECLQAAYAVAGLDAASAAGESIEPPPGMTEQAQKVIPGQGFAAAEFTDAEGNIIIADEGADLASPFGKATPYQNASVIAGGLLLADATPALIGDAVAFAQSVQANDSTSAPIYVTGFDFGGVEAQAQAQALGSAVAGGLTFGASGLPGNTGAGSQSGLVNIVDYGDAVGNWASDQDSELASMAPKNMSHYGPVDLVGIPNDALLPLLAANTHKLLTSSALDEALGPDWNRGDGFDHLLDIAPATQAKALNLYDRLMLAASYAYLAGSAVLYHSIAQYAADLHVSLAGTVAPAISMADYVKEYDPSASDTSLKAADATTVNADGTVAAPSYDLAADTATDQLTSESYIAANKSQYDVTYDPAEEISTLKVNDPDGTSYEIFNDDSGQYIWSTSADFYSGPNQTGTLTGTLYNWTAGGSQLLVFTGLPKGDTEEILNYSQPDATGTLLSRTFIK